MPRVWSACQIKYESNGLTKPAIRKNETSIRTFRPPASEIHTYVFLTMPNGTHWEAITVNRQLFNGLLSGRHIMVVELYDMWLARYH